MTPATLSLAFQVAEETTYMRVLRQDPPWRTVRAFRNQAGEALVHLHNLSGGILGGDNLKLEIKVEPKAQAQVTSVGATRIYRRRAEAAGATQTSFFSIAEDALLEYLPDPFIPFAQSCFCQSSEVHLSPGAGFICWETLSAGRVASGEAFGFENFSANTAIYCDHPRRPIALERYSLSPALHRLDSPARMGPFLHSASMYICRVDAHTGRWLPLERTLSGIADSLSGAHAAWGASTLSQHGIAVRGLACEAHQIARGLETFWRTAKQEVWGRKAILPRKVN